MACGEGKGWKNFYTNPGAEGNRYFGPGTTDGAYRYWDFLPAADSWDDTANEILVDRSGVVTRHNVVAEADEDGSQEFSIRGTFPNQQIYLIASRGLYEVTRVKYDFSTRSRGKRTRTRNSPGCWWNLRRCGS